MKGKLWWLQKVFIVQNSDSFLPPASDFLLTLLLLIISSLPHILITSQADALCSPLTCCFSLLCNTCTFLVPSIHTHGPNLSLVFCQGVTSNINFTLSVFLAASEIKFPNRLRLGTHDEIFIV